MATDPDQEATAKPVASDQLLTHAQSLWSRLGCEARGSDELAAVMCEMAADVQALVDPTNTHVDWQIKFAADHSRVKELFLQAFGQLDRDPVVLLDTLTKLVILLRRVAGTDGHFAVIDRLKPLAEKAHGLAYKKVKG